jgi:hypothetical protein
VRHKTQDRITDATGEHDTPFPVMATHMGRYVRAAHEQILPVDDGFKGRFAFRREQDTDGYLSLGVDGTIEKRRCELQIDLTDLAIRFEPNPAAVSCEVDNANPGSCPHYIRDFDHLQASVRRGNLHGCVDPE